MLKKSCWLGLCVASVFASGAFADVSVISTPAVTNIKPTDQNKVVVSTVDVESLKNAWGQMLKGELTTLGKHPLADDFPGPVPANAARVTRVVSIDASIPRWHSTGLYAPPGEVITVTFPADMVNTGVDLRIGAHKDGLWNKKPTDSWVRFPQITVSRPVKTATMKIACPFGGLVYIDIPSDKTTNDRFSVKIEGAVEAPLFEIGKTSVSDWKKTLRSAPGPWAELAGKRIIFTVPSESIRTMDDPTELIKLWDSYLDACSDLSGRSRDRASPERFVFDRQISAGWMHSGYPIMAHLKSIPEAVDLAQVKEVPWGPLHELGHNHQQGAWTNGFNGEVSNNLFPLYVRRKFLNLTIGGHPSLAPNKMGPSLATMFALPVAERKPDLFQRLWMYDSLSDQFGFEVWTQMWKQYDALPKEQWPKDDTSENTQALIRLSKITKHNLAPYFQEWNYPADYTQLGEIEKLPAWKPKGFPKMFGKSDGPK